MGPIRANLCSNNLRAAVSISNKHAQACNHEPIVNAPAFQLISQTRFSIILRVCSETKIHHTLPSWPEGKTSFLALESWMIATNEQVKDLKTVYPCHQWNDLCPLNVVTAHWNNKLMLLSLSLLNVFETTLQGLHSNQTTISLIPGLEWNGTKEGEGWQTLHMRSAKGVDREMREYAEGVYREFKESLQRMQREFTEKCKGSLRGKTEGVYREMQSEMSSCTRPNLRRVGSSPHPYWECQLLYALTVTLGGGGLTTPSIPHYISTTLYPSQISSQSSAHTGREWSGPTTASDQFTLSNTQQ